MRACFKLQNLRPFRTTCLSRFCTATDNTEKKDKLPIFKISKKSIKDSSLDIKELNTSINFGEFFLSRMRFEAGKYLYDKVDNATFEDFKISELGGDRKNNIKPSFNFLQVIGPSFNGDYLNNFCNLECAQIHLVFSEFEKGKFMIQTTFDDSYIGGENTGETIAQFLNTIGMVDKNGIKDAAKKVIDNLETSKEVEITIPSTVSNSEPVKFKFIQTPFRNVLSKYVGHTKDICEYVMQTEDQKTLKHRSFTLIGRLTQLEEDKHQHDPQQTIVTLAAIVGDLLIGDVKDVTIEVIIVTGLEIISKGKLCCVVEEGTKLPCRVTLNSVKDDLEVFLTFDSNNKLLLERATLPKQTANWNLLVDISGKMALIPN